MTVDLDWENLGFNYRNFHSVISHITKTVNGMRGN